MQIKKVWVLLLAVLALGAMGLGLSSSKASAQATTYPLSTLTGPNDFNFLLQVQAIKFEAGKWTYHVVWNRTRAAEGTALISPKVNELVRVAELDPAPSAKPVSNPWVVQLDPATRYVFRYYAVTGCDQDGASADPECVPIREIYFNTRDASGKTLDTSEVPLSNGGTKVNTSASDTLSTITTGLSANSSIESLQAMVTQLLAMVQALLAQMGGGSTNSTEPLALCSYSEPPAGCSYVNGPAFNPLTRCGMILNCGGTATTTTGVLTTVAVPTNTTTLAIGPNVPLPGDPNVPIGQGGFKTNCTIPAPVVTMQNGMPQPPRIVFDTATWQCLTGITTTATSGDPAFGNGVKVNALPGNLVQNLFLNHPKEVAYRKFYKILHFVPFPNNPTVTNPDDPEAAINLPYEVDIAQDMSSYTVQTPKYKGDIDYDLSGVGSIAAAAAVQSTQGKMASPHYRNLPSIGGGYKRTYTGYPIKTLFPNLSYNVRWKVANERILSKDGRSYGVPQTVDVYIYNQDSMCPGYFVGIANVAKSSCAKNFQDKLADEAQGKFFDFGGRGFVKVASNVPYQNGQAQFFLPELRNITYPGKITKGYEIGSGPFSVVVMDSRATELDQRYSSRAPLIYNPTNNNDLYPNPPVHTNEEIMIKTPIAAINIAEGVHSPLNWHASIRVDTVANGVAGPMPWYVVKTSGVGDDWQGTTREIYDKAPFREISIAGSVGRPFWQSMYYIPRQRDIKEAISPAPEISYEGQLPPGLRRNTNFAGHNTESGTVPIANIEGTPLQAGEYTVDVKAKVRYGNKVVEGITRYHYYISPMRKLDIVFQDLNGNQITSARAGDTIRILKIGDDLSTDPSKLYIAPTGSNCNTSDPRNFGKCAGSVAIHPDFVKKTPLGDMLKDSPCNNSMMGGNDPLMGNCAEYTWRVGNVPGVDLSSGSFVVYALPTKLGHDGHIHLGGTETFDPWTRGSSGQWDFYAAGTLNITPGTGGNTTGGTTGTDGYIHYAGGRLANSQYLRFTCIVNDVDKNCMANEIGSAGGVDSVNSQWVTNSVFGAQPGDRVTIRWSAKMSGSTNPAENRTYPSNAVWGNDWDSKIEMIPSGWSQSIDGPERVACTRSINPPAGFGFSQADFTNVIRGPEGSFSFTVPDCLKGGGMIMTYSAIMNECTSPFGCATGRDTLRMTMQVGGWRSNDDIVQNSPIYNPANPNATATCDVVPNMFDGLSGHSLMNDWDTRNICTGSAGLNGTCYTANYGVDYASAKFDRLLFRAGTDLAAVLGGCSAADMSAGKCIMKSGDPGDSLWPNGLRGTASTNIVIKNTRPNTTYWNRIVAICNYGQANQQYSEAIWPYTTKGPACTGLLNCPN